MNLSLRDAHAGDHSRVVAINAAEDQYTSPMNEDRLASIASMACYFKVAIVADTTTAFLIGMRENARYDSVNYRWFADRYDRFLYIDRIVVDAAWSGRGIGRLLYEDVVRFARLHEIGSVTCEYNVQPPNAASAAFHSRLGFREIGTQWVVEGTKQVSLQEYRVAD